MSTHPRVRSERVDLTVAPVMIDVSVRDHHVRELAKVDAELRQGRRDLRLHRPVNPGVNQQHALRPDHDPLHQPAFAEQRLNATDPRSWSRGGALELPAS